MTETPQSEDPDPTEMYCLDNAGGISTGREGPVFETKSIFCLALGVGGDAMELIHSTGRHCQHE